MILEFCNKLNLHPDCTAAMCATREAIRNVPAAENALQLSCCQLMEGQEEACAENLKRIVETTGENRYTVMGVMLLEAIPLLKNLYAQKGYAEELMWDTLIDLKCKFDENHDVGAAWGTSALAWYIRLYRTGIIKLGRLEFEPTGYKWDTPYRGIQKGDPVMNMHIPSVGPMKIEDVLDAFKQAYKFYGYTEPMPVMAASWLLYPPICEQVFKPGSNLKNFYDLFDVVETYEDPANHNFWRIYNMDWEEGVLDRVPLDTSLRRNLHAFMKPGVNMGVGRCMLLFDGEKVISK